MRGRTIVCILLLVRVIESVAPPPPPSTQNWEAIYDQATGRYYFHNPKTGKVSWTLPGQKQENVIQKTEIGFWTSIDIQLNAVLGKETGAMEVALAGGVLGLTLIGGTLASFVTYYFLT